MDPSDVQLPFDPAFRLFLGKSRKAIEAEHANVGYSGFFPHAAAVTHLEREHTLLCPDYCCVCDEPAQTYLPLGRARRFLWRFRAAPSEVPMNVPHCKLHAANRKYAQLAAYYTLWGNLADGAFIIGFFGGLRFLQDTYKMNTAGEPLPLWVPFPNNQPYGGWNQGAQQEYRNKTWNPFWEQLPDQDRLDYLTRWNATDDWREALLHPLFPTPGRPPSSPEND